MADCNTLIKALDDAINASLGGRTNETKAIARRHARFFVAFCKEQSLSLPLPRTVLSTFLDYLAQQSYDSCYVAAIHGNVKSLLQWIGRNAPTLTGELQLDYSVRVRRARKQVEAGKLSEAVVQRILSAAYAQIAATEERLRKNREMYKAGTHPDIDALSVVLTGHATHPMRAQGELKSAERRLIQGAGGLERLRSLLFVGCSDVFPFYLAMLCQCAANPMSFRELRRACLLPHPLRADREHIVWDKLRSGREQIASFSLKRPNSSPNLVRRLTALSEGWMIAESPWAEDLFVAASKSGVMTISWQSLHNELRSFIRRHELPAFTFKELRKANAEQHARVSGTVLVAAQRLNHRDSKVTQRSYVAPNVLQAVHDDRIAMHQQELHELTRRQRPAIGKSAELGFSADTVFGFKCRNPMAGFKREPDTYCLNFSGCATCPGAVVVLDDIEVVARILAARQQLIDAKVRATTEGWLDRYLSIYSDTEAAIEQDILPKVSSVILEKAKLRVAGQPVLHLE